jgi:hypothetical protein
MTAPFKKISTWRERIGQTADFPLHVPTDVERAMVAEIADLRASLVAGPLPQVQRDVLDEAPIECWSADQEDFSATELDSVLTAREDLNPGDTVWMGQAVRPDASQLIDADDVVTMMGERAYDIASEHADGYPDVTKEAEQELNEFLTGWVGKHAKPHFWTVLNVRPYVLSHGDFPNDPSPVQCDVPAADQQPVTPSGALADNDA